MARAVAVLTEVAAVDKVFDYALPADVPDREPGDRVRVNLHGRSVRGWVLGPATSHGELKPVTKTLGLGPPERIVALSAWAARRWAGPRSRFLLAASPDKIVTVLPALPSAPPLSGAVAAATLAVAPGVVQLGPTLDPLPLILHAYDQARDAGSLLVLVPTEAWARRLGGRLSQRGVPVAFSDQWDRARAGWPVVVGPRGAAWAPVPTVGGGVVIDGDDEAYRSEAAPTWDAVSVVLERCRDAGAPCWVTSPLPSPSLRAATHTRTVAPGEVGAWPDVTVADRRHLDPRDGALAEPALAAARAALETSEPVAVVVLSQRLGAGRLLACRSCGALARCERCGQGEREAGEGLTCPFDGSSRARFCRSCGSTSLRALRAGVTTLARDVANQLAQPVTELTAASADGPLHRVVVGTEATLTRVRRAGAFIFADFDQYLLAPRERARRDAVLAVARAGRLVGGRAESRGVVVLQTRRGDDGVIDALARAEFSELAAADDDDARTLGLPPYGAIATLSGEGAVAYGAALASALVTVHDDGGGNVIATAATLDALVDRLASIERPAQKLRVAVV